MTELERIARDFYCRVSAGDYEGVISMLSDDVLWTIPGPSQVPYAGAYRGRAAVVEFFRILALCEDLQSFEPTEFIVDEDRGVVCVLGCESAVAIPTGKAFTAEWAEIFHFRDGLIAKFTERIDTHTLAEAYSTGASPQP